MESEAISVRQRRLDNLYKIIVGLIALVVTVAILATFVQIYSINSKINSEVQQIQAAQKQGRIINNQQNNVVLGYLICIATVQPADRTPTIINACVIKAQKDNSISNQ